MVAPVTVTAASQEPLFIYELCESDPLPMIDLSRRIGNACCSSEESRTAALSTGCPWWIKACWVFAYVVSPLAVIGTLRAAEPTDRRLAVLAVFTSFPYWVFHFRALRFDMVLLMLQSPEFWYFTVTTLSWCSLLGFYLNGMRAAVTLIFFTSSISGILVDANAVLGNHLITATVSVVVTNIAVTGLINRRMVENVNNNFLASNALQIEDAIMSGLLTYTLHAMRNAYRRRREIAEQRRVGCTRLRCIVYRRRARLRLIEESNRQERANAIVPACGVESSAAVTENREPVAVASSLITTVKLERIPVNARFNAANTVFPVNLTAESWPKRIQLTIGAASWIGIFLTMATFAGPIETTPRNSYRIATAIIALALSSCCCGLYWSLCQLKLLRHIIFSFDFLYLSLQLSLVHLCVCELFSWDIRCFAVLCSWLWTHIVLTSDAVVPIVRAKTGLRERHLAPILTVFLVGLITLLIKLEVSENWQAATRIMVSFSIGPRKFEVRVVRVLLARTVSILWWSLRVLVRVWRAKDGDMIELRIRVGYYTRPKAAQQTEQSKLSSREPGAANSLPRCVASNQVAPLISKAQ